MQRILVEICVTDVESAVAAEAGGAGRIELCTDLAQGGVTPGAGLIAAVVERLTIPVHVMIRPRGGDFTMSPLELEVMHKDIEMVKQLGGRGVVLGVLEPSGSIARGALRELIARSRPLAVVFHKELIELGVEAVLTAGGAARARDGGPELERLVKRARDRIAIIAGGGIRLEDIAPLVRERGLRALHCGSAAAVIEPGRPGSPRDGSNTRWWRVDAARVRAIVEEARRASQ
jgi:copper homeostasis protein